MEILLTTLNARYIHASFGLRYLQANLGELTERSQLCEFGIKQRPIDIVESLLEYQPRIIALGVYIWNASACLQVVRLLKKVAPSVKLVLGGPEVSYETEEQEIVAQADVTITGEADLVFAEVCRKLLADEPVAHVIAAPLPEMNQVALPYYLYSDQDLAQRVVYVEASRGCPYTCEFCLSSLDIPVRRPTTEAFLSAMQDLLDRGCRHFKFVDRTFNLNLKLSRAILEFFLERLQDGLFLHFEMVPDRLPEALRELIARFPAGMLQFEVGIQTFNSEVAERISLKRDFDKAADNFYFLRHHTGGHVHADLIAGLPGEDIASFADGFDRLQAMEPHEIQVGILKRLRGTPIARHSEAFGMVFNSEPPYEVLATHHLTFAELQRLKRFSQLWDRVGNSGRFPHTLALMQEGNSPFWSFMAYCDWLWQETGKSFEIGLDRQARLLWRYLTGTRELPRQPVGEALAADLNHLGKHIPPWLKDFSEKPADPSTRKQAPNTQRQERHQEPLRK